MRDETKRLARLEEILELLLALSKGNYAKLESRKRSSIEKRTVALEALDKYDHVLANFADLTVQRCRRADVELAQLQGALAEAAKAVVVRRVQLKRVKARSKKHKNRLVGASVYYEPTAIIEDSFPR